MKKMKVTLSVFLVLCMMLSFAPLRGQASASRADWEWYWNHNHDDWDGDGYIARDGTIYPNGLWVQAQFTEVRVPVENIPTSLSTNASGTATAAGSTTWLAATSFSYYFNEWAKTLIIRGTGEMPKFDELHPAPWANLKDRAARVILDRNITTISANAFVDFSLLRSVVLPMTLKTIDPMAFTWSDEVRKLPTFQKLERLEYSGDLDDLDKILKACNIQDLLDARIVKVTEKAIQDEITQLTWLRLWKPLRVKYDSAGRPVRIYRIDKNGYAYDTVIEYVNESDMNTHSDTQPISIDAVDASGNVTTNLTREVVEKRQTLSVFPDGGSAYYEKERNDLGQQTYYAAFNLDSSDRKVSGTQTFAGETGVYKTGVMNATYASDGTGTMTWDNIYWSATGDVEALETVIEQLSASGQVKSVKTTKTDTSNKVISTTEATNTYDSKTGRLEKVSVTSTDASSTTTTATTEYKYNKAGQVVSTKTTGDVSASETYTYDGNGNLTKYEKTGADPVTVTYTYDKNGLKTSRTETSGSDTVTTKFNIRERANTETVKINGETLKYEYSYKDNTVSERLVKDASGKGIGKDTFNSDGFLVKSVRTSGSTTTTMNYTYDSDGVLIKTNGVRTVSAVTAESDTPLTSEAMNSDLENSPIWSTPENNVIYTAPVILRNLSFKNAMFSASSLNTALNELSDEELENAESVELFELSLNPETGNMVQSQAVLSAKALSFTTSTTNSQGERLSYASEYADEDGDNSSLKLNTDLGKDGDLQAQTEEVSDFNNTTKQSKYLFNASKQPLSLKVTEKAEDGNVRRSFTTYKYSEDGSYTETVTDLNLDGTILGTYSIPHEAPPVTDLPDDEEIEEDLDETEEAEEEGEEAGEVEEGEEETEPADGKDIEKGTAEIVFEENGDADPADIVPDEDGDEDDNKDEEEIDDTDVPLAAPASDTAGNDALKETEKEETKAEETKAEETKTEETKPEETKTEETKAEETKAEETKVEETKDEETKVEETKTEETKVEETKAEETKPEETKTEETKVEETKVEETKVEETKTEETKVEETKAEAPVTTASDDAAAAQKAAEEAAAAQKAAEEEAARKKAAEEEAARKKAEEEEAARKRAEEEAARKKAEEEEAARKRAEEEEAAKKKAAEEEAARKAAEEEAAAA